MLSNFCQIYKLFVGFGKCCFVPGYNISFPLLKIIFETDQFFSTLVWQKIKTFQHLFSVQCGSVKMRQLSHGYTNYLWPPGFSEIGKDWQRRQQYK